MSTRAPRPEADASPSIEVAYARPERQRVVRLALPEGGLTALEAVERSGLLQEFPEIGAQPLTLGVFGAPCAHDRKLQAEDRVEIYRPLAHDPRAQRRERVAAARRPQRRRG